MSLDIRTLALLLAVVTFVTAIALYLFYRLLPETPGLKQAAIGAGCQSLGSILSIARDFIPLEVAIVSSNGLYLLASAFFYQAARLLSDQHAEWKWPGIMIALLLPPFLFFPTNEYLGLRIQLLSIGLALLSFMTTWVLLRDIPAKLPARRGAALAIGGIGLVSVYRLVNTTIHPPGTASFLDKGDQYIIFVWAIVSAIIYAIAMIVMTSERLRETLKQQLSELAIANRIADNALREQKNFLTMLSHEFRTPLGIIKANVDAIFSASPVRDNFTEESLHRISNASTRLTSLVQGCLNDEWISNAVERGQLERSKLDLRQILSALCDEYRVNFSCNTASPVIVQGDRYLIPILFSSLIDNARKYAASADGVNVRCVHQDRQILIEVEDNGPGIPVEERKHIFDKYYRIRNGNKRPGTGLGLFFVKHITEQHGGKIDVEQRTGALFRITLPESGEPA